MSIKEYALQCILLHSDELMMQIPVCKCVSLHTK